MKRDPADPRIFVSYARSDGEAFARALREKLTRKFSLWHDLQDMEGGRDWWRQITEAIDAVEYLVLVMTPAALRSDVVRREWRHARQQGRCVVPVMGAKPLDFSSLPRWMASAHFYDLDIPEQWKRFVRQLESPCTSPRVPMMAPSTPVDFVARPEEFAALKTALLDARGEPVAITSALKGAGGYGKTTLAKALCADGDIQDAYHDGVLWVTLGESPGDPQGRIEDLIHVLRGARESFATRDAALARLGELLADRRCLLVIDDVWHRGDAEPFLRVGPSCARLLTTRDSAALPDDIHDIRVDELQTEQAVELLQKGLPPADPARLRALAGRLGEWPLLLKLANGALRERVNRLRAPLPDALTHVERLLDRRGLTAFDAGNARSRDEAVGMTLGLSLDVLSEAERTRLSELAVFPEDLAIPLPVIELLWQQTAGIDEIDTEDTLRQLFALSLLLDLDLTDRTARLHDVIRAWLRQRLGCDGLAALDQHLVGGYRELCAGVWHELPDDGYALQHLLSHLRVVDQAAWRNILFDLRWLARKLEQVGVPALIADYEDSHDKDLQLIGDGLRLSAHVLARDPAQLAGQICGRLGALEQLACRRIVDAARSCSGQASLVPRLPSLTAPGGPLLQVLTGHGSRVRAVAVAPDGRQAVSGGADGTLRVWALASGTEQLRLEGHMGPVLAIAITPDGQHAVSGGADGTLRVWELASGTERLRLEGHMGSVWAITVTPDGRHAVSGGNDGTLRVWELASGAQRYCLENCHRGMISAVAVTLDGQHAVSGGADGTLQEWELASGTRRRRRDGYRGWVLAVVVTPEGGDAVSGDAYGTLRVWGFAGGSEQNCLEGHKGWVWAVAVTPGGRHAVSSGEDGTLRVWDLASRTERQRLDGHTGRVSAIAVTPDSRHTVSGGADGTLRVWELASGIERHSLNGHRDWILAVVVTPDGKCAVSGARDCTLRVWDLASGAERHRLEGHGDWVWAVAVTPDGKRAISGGNDGTLRVWELSSGKMIGAFTGESAIHAVTVVSDRVFAAGDADGVVHIIDLIE